MDDEGVGVIGLGPMGGPIAERLAASMDDVAVWNRTASVAERLSQRGARVGMVPADVAQRVVLTVLPDLPQVESVLAGENGLVAGWWRRGTRDPVLVVHGTVSPAGVRDLAERVRAQAGVHVVDAPLSGGTIGAREGSLSVMVGAEEDLFDRLLPLFQRYATTVLRMGPVGAGSVAKACNQIVVASTVAAVSEAVALARRSGLDVRQLMRVLMGGLGDSAVIRQKSDKWVHCDFGEGGSATNQVKDLEFAIDAANRVDLDVRLVRTVLGLFKDMVASGDGALDHTGVYRTIEGWGGANPIRPPRGPASESRPS